LNGREKGTGLFFLTPCTPDAWYKKEANPKPLPATDEDREEGEQPPIAERTTGVFNRPGG
jgi:hypothetical protein